MGAFSSKATGGWDQEGTSTWNEAGHPQAGDTVTVQTGHTVSLESVTAATSLTIETGAEVDTTGTDYALTLTSALVIAGTFTANGSVLELDAVTVNDGGLYSLMASDSNIDGALTVGGGASGLMTVADNGALDLGGTLTINTGATLGTADIDWVFDIEGDIAVSTGTLIAPNASGNFYVRDGYTWRTPSTFTHSSGEVTFLGMGTTTLGNDSTSFYDVQVANFTTLALSTFAFTCADLNIGGGVSGTVTTSTGTKRINGDFSLGTGAIFGSADVAYTLDMNGNTTNASGTFIAPNAAGTFTFAGSTWRQFATFTHSSGVVTFDGTTILSTHSAGFYGLDITGSLSTGGANYNLTAASDVTISGTLDLNASAVDFNGDLEIEGGGTLTASTATTTFTGTTWTTTGTFTHSSGSVVFDGNAQEIDGSTGWHNFDKHTGAATTLTIDNTSTQTVGGALNLYGVSGQLLSILSDLADNAFNLTLTGTKGTLQYLSVKDSDASGSDADVKPIAPTNSTDVSGNTSWFGSEGQPAMQVVIIS